MLYKDLIDVTENCLKRPPVLCQNFIEKDIYLPTITDFIKMKFLGQKVNTDIEQNLAVTAFQTIS